MNVQQKIRLTKRKNEKTRALKLREVMNAICLQNRTCESLNDVHPTEVFAAIKTCDPYLEVSDFLDTVATEIARMKMATIMLIMFGDTAIFCHLLIETFINYENTNTIRL